MDNGNVIINPSLSTEIKNIEFMKCLLILSALISIILIACRKSMPVYSDTRLYVQFIFHDTTTEATDTLDILTNMTSDTFAYPPNTAKARSYINPPFKIHFVDTSATSFPYAKIEWQLRNNGIITSGQRQIALVTEGTKYVTIVY